MFIMMRTVIIPDSNLGPLNKYFFQTQIVNIMKLSLAMTTNKFMWRKLLSFVKFVILSDLIQNEILIGAESVNIFLID